MAVLVEAHDELRALRGVVDGVHCGDVERRSVVGEEQLPQRLAHRLRLADVRRCERLALGEQAALGQPRRGAVRLGELVLERLEIERVDELADVVQLVRRRLGVVVLVCHSYPSLDPMTVIAKSLTRAPHVSDTAIVPSNASH